MKNTYYRLKAAIKNLVCRPYLLLLLVAYACVSRYALQNIRHISATGTAFDVLSNLAFVLILGLWVILSFYFFLVLGDLPVQRKFESAFQSIGLDDHCNNVPILIEKKKKKGQLIYYFDSAGITLSDWEKVWTNLESALNITISEIGFGKRTQDIYICCTKGHIGLTEPVTMREFDIPFGTALVLGKKTDGTDLMADLCTFPHFLIGGSTGSGKTYLLKSLLFQCIYKGYKVIIADYKGGVDYALPYWRENSSLIDTDKALIVELQSLIQELDRRKGLLFDTNCKDIEAYNQKCPFSPLKHIIFACDELAELLDLTGLSKEEKETKKKISSSIATVARLGRAFGIHLFLSTQRPDAEIVSGQIKNNIIYRICGRADEVLSRIILDNGNAAEKVPANGQGVFINQDGVLFKGYLLDKDV